MAETQLTLAVEEKVALLSADLEQQAILQAEQLAAAKAVVAKHVHELQQVVQEQVNENTVELDQATQHLEHQTHELALSLASIKRKREQSDEALLAALKNNLTQIKATLEAEKHDR